MEFNLVIWGLVMGAMALLFTDCRNTRQKETLMYVGYDWHTKEVFDTLVIQCDGNSCQILESDFFHLGSFVMSNINEEEILLGTESCDTNIAIRLSVGEQVDNPCSAILPFVGDMIMVLDRKKLNVNGQKFTIFKIYNEAGSSDEDGSAIYWVNGIGVLYIGMDEGRCYELRVEGKSNTTTNLVLEAMKKDIDFSDRWPLLPPPPPPDILEDE